MSSRDAHASLGASSAYRWMNCSGSPRLIASLPEPERARESRYARQGSAAHFLGESCLSRGVAANEYLDFVLTKSTGAWELIKPPRGVHELAEDDFVVDEEMVEAVQVYLDDIAATRASSLHLIELVEARVQPLEDRPEMFGTLDYGAVDPIDGVLRVKDYKHGAGVFVEAEGNPQIRYYGLGALRKVGSEGIEKVELSIVQPRAQAKEPIRREILTARELVEWGGVLRSAADATLDPNAPLRAGSWCGFCPAAARCPAFRAKVQRDAGADFDEIDPSAIVPTPASALADPEKLSRALEAIPLIDAWSREVEGYAQRHLERGGSIPGFKLVRKRGRRQWKSEAELEADFKAIVELKTGVRTEDLYEKKLRSPAQLEKVKGVGKAWVADRCEKVAGGLTIASEADPRPAAPAPALADFAEVTSDDDDVLMLGSGSTEESLL